ncbi:replicative DNA helicase [Pseudoxanthomonas kaohsiungensis]|uniref:Replicative DNA helicase n=1 Tax=Pseudoxanthomonas kaohsiungensis TaxID=283923 RepID=A0ABW3LX83_9GAMM|nr:replicative DNA helicase [Pseudoxanthomonas kaohsiungensis]KAF1702999.1 replicative DNA helicase [Pseudoxanthomonas kaohsiungensis]
MANGQARNSRGRSRGRSLGQEAELARVMLPPQSIEAEQAVLGGLMLANDMFDVVEDMLEVRDFYRRDHQLIYQAMKDLAEKSRPFDAVTLGEWFDANGASEQVGGGSYLVDLATTTPSAANIVAYAKIVNEKALLRRVIEAGTEIVNQGFNPDGLEAAEVVAEAEQKIFAVGQEARYEETGAVPVKEATHAMFRRLQEHYNAGGGITGLPTGYHELDEKLSGLNPTDLIILAARPAMGKTTFALNIAENAAVKSKKAVAVFSMEMSKEQLSQRLVSSMGRVDANRLRTARLEDEDWSHITSAIRQINDITLVIDDTPALSPDRLRSRARRIKRQHANLGLIVIDYLQLMTVPGTNENRATEVSEISRSLKALAKELNVPVIALSQLNRGVETRSDKRPVMADLRESGSIEQDADVVAFIYRDDYYDKENSPDKGLAEIIIAKQRMGETGTVKLRFHGQYSRFSNLRDDPLEDLL